MFPRPVRDWNELLPEAVHRHFSSRVSSYPQKRPLVPLPSPPPTPLFPLPLPPAGTAQNPVTVMVRIMVRTLTVMVGILTEVEENGGHLLVTVDNNNV